MMLTYLDCKNKIERQLKDTKRVCFKLLKDDKIIPITSREIIAIIDSFKQLCQKYDIQAGDRIGLLTTNQYQASVMLLCAIYCHITIVPFYCQTSPMELESLVEEVDLKVLFTDEELYNHFALKQDYPIFAINYFDYILLNNVNKTKTISNRDENVAVIIFSSGTSTKCKPVMLSYQSLLVDVENVTEDADIRTEYEVLTIFPICHISGTITFLSCFFNSLTVIAPSNFNVKDLKHLLEITNPAAFGMTPKVLELMISKAEDVIRQDSTKWNYYCKMKNFSAWFISRFNSRLVGKIFLAKFRKAIFNPNISIIYTGSSKCEEYVADTINQLGIAFINIYASTEGGCPICASTLKQPYCTSDEGIINQSTQIAIHEPNQQGVGEIYVKSTSMMLGYFNDKELTKQSFDGGYLKSGDLGYLDDKQHLHVIGRLKECIILSNGEKVSPEDLENVLSHANKDVQIAVAGINNDSFYDKIAVFYLNKNYDKQQQQIIKNNLFAYIKEKNLNYTIGNICFVDSFPMTAIGKIKRKQLVDMIENSSKEKQANSPFEFICDLIQEFKELQQPLRENDIIADLGLDSLTIFNFSLKIKEKYDVDIIGELNSETTIKDLVNMIDNKQDIKQTIKFRKIKLSETKEMARKSAIAFNDYPLNAQLLPKEEQRNRALFYIELYNILRRFEFTYINEEKTVLISFKKPNDKITYKYIIFDIPFIAKFVSVIGIKGVKALLSYSQLSQEITKKYYNPEVDNYICNIFVDKKYQGTSLFFDTLRYFDDGNSIYAETHSLRNIELYKAVGAYVCDEVSIGTAIHYCIRRDKKVA